MAPDITQYVTRAIELLLKVNFNHAENISFNYVPTKYIYIFLVKLTSSGIFAGPAPKLCIFTMIDLLYIL